MRDNGVISSVQQVSASYGQAGGQVQTDSACFGLTRKLLKKPTFSDMFLVYSTLPGECFWCVFLVFPHYLPKPCSFPILLLNSDLISPNLTSLNTT